MIDNIIDALEIFHGDDEEQFADDLVYLAHIRKHDLFYFENRAARKLLDMDRCPYCGARYEHREYYELHDELEGKPREKMIATYCPNGCDA